MSQSDFSAHSAAIAPAVTEIDRPKIEVNQVWRTRSGEVATVESIDSHDDYPVNIKIGGMNSCCGKNGRIYGDIGVGADESFDLVELIQDADGFTIWRGGSMPVSPGTKVEYRLRLGGHPMSSSDASCLRWENSDLAPGHDIVAYKVMKDAVEAPAIIGIDPGAEGGDKSIMSVVIPSGYEGLFSVLVAAFEQASQGKGKERHASAGVAFEDQPISAINRTLGSVDGLLYQAAKKSAESRRLPAGRAQAEIYGAINYLAAAAIAYDTWAAESLPKN